MRSQEGVEQNYGEKRSFDSLWLDLHLFQAPFYCVFEQRQSFVHFVKTLFAACSKDSRRSHAHAHDASVKTGDVML